MQLLAASHVGIRRIDPPADNAAPSCEITVNGQPAGRLVPGAVLEAAAQWQSFTLLFNTDDTPFEELLHIHLLDAQLNLLDSATIGGIYSTGSFSLLESAEPDTLRFRFIGGTDWGVQVLPQPGFRLPLVSEPARVSRHLGYARHFIVRGQPQPERA